MYQVLFFVLSPMLIKAPTLVIIIPLPVAEETAQGHTTGE